MDDEQKLVCVQTQTLICKQRLSMVTKLKSSVKCETKFNNLLYLSK